MTRRVRRALAMVGVAALLAATVGVIFLRGRGDRPPRFGDFVGNETCLGCHTEQRSFAGTAHHRTSAPASSRTIAASFAPGENTLSTPNPALRYHMDARPDGFFQTAVVGEPPDTSTISKRIDLVIGSGRKGQTYLYWESGDRLYQLPISYWTALQAWISSPGYPEGVVNFERPVAPRCLECHSTFFEPAADSQGVHRYAEGRSIPGISCEKCHGAGRDHVARQRSPVTRFLGTPIVNPAELPRQRQLELCAQCHGGVGEPVTPSFSYRPGQPLEQHLRLPPTLPNEALDVHGNQVALLQRSTCFAASDMTCSTCHDVHQTQRNPAAFSARCLSCHQAQTHEAVPELGATITNRCVDCHMPELPSRMIVSRQDGRSVQPRIRSHWIRVYAAGELN
ncbi:MAG: cytochrome c3 family protein [Gemmatimonadetes bacterium]|nr:cytochrome c3 family protein [Gemmatimonadota bacterium]